MAVRERYLAPLPDELWWAVRDQETSQQRLTLMPEADAWCRRAGISYRLEIDTDPFRMNRLNIIFDGPDELAMWTMAWS